MMYVIAYIFGEELQDPFITKAIFWREFVSLFWPNYFWTKRTKEKRFIIRQGIRTNLKKPYLKAI